VIALSPTASSSTAIQPRVVRIRVPSAKHATACTVLPLTIPNEPAPIAAPKIIESIPPEPAPVPLSENVSVSPLLTFNPDNVPPVITN
jgi:hypothetical protein